MSTILEDPIAEEVLSDYELERGKPMPSWNHSRIQALIIGEFLKDKRFDVLSELTIRLDKDYTPDISIYPRRPTNWQHDIVKSTEVPLLVVEIFSPQQAPMQVMSKLDAYFEAGVKSCWLITPHLRLISIITADRVRRNFDKGTVTDPAIGITAEVEAVFE